MGNDPNSVPACVFLVYMLVEVCFVKANFGKANFAALLFKYLFESVLFKFEDPLKFNIIG